MRIPVAEGFLYDRSGTFEVKDDVLYYVSDSGGEWVVDIPAANLEARMTPRWTPHADLGTNERSGT